MEAALVAAGLLRPHMRGSELWALCPNRAHKDRRVGSWSIHVEPGSKRNGRSKCYACDFHGDAFDTVAELRGCSRDEAIAFCKPFALDVTSEEFTKPVKPWIEDNGWYAIKPVDLPPSEAIIGGGACAEYLRSRAVRMQEIKTHGLRDWVEARRVLVPIRMFGRTVSWVARLYRKQRGDEPKVLTPRRGSGGENGIFSLFGLELADRSLGCATIVEGWVDAIRLEQAGVANPIAVCGSELNERKAALLGWCENVTVIGDGDDAGRKMARNVHGWLATAERRVRIVECPEGKDPGDLSAEALGELLQ